MPEINTADTIKQTTGGNKKINPELKKITIPLIIIIIFLSILTIYLNSKTQKILEVTQSGETPSPTSQISPDAQSIINLMPNPLTLDTTGRGAINVNIETGGNEVTAVQLELKYDPSAITDVAIVHSDFFTNPIELFKRIDTQNGRITYMLGISTAQNPISGSGTVAKITFRKVRETKLSSTTIKFSKTENSESIVAATGIDQSVLRYANDTTINLN